jgi:hypothetical protein
VSIKCEKSFTLKVKSGVVVPVPFAYYKLDAWSGAAVDSIAARNLTLLSGVPPPVIPGIISNGYNITDSRLQVSDPSFDFSGIDFSVRFWFQTNNAASNGRPLEGFASGDVGIWLFRYEPTTGMFWFVKATTTIGSTALTPGTWHHIVGWCKVGVEIGLMIDNVLVGVTPLAGDCGPGIDTWRFPFFLGLPPNVLNVDEVSIWKGQSLTEAQINLDWNAGAGRTWPW